MNIQEMVSILSNTNLRRFVDILICKVTEIDKTDNTISCICLNDAEYEVIEGVQLNIDFDVNSQITYPEIGSTVLVIYQASIGGVAFQFTATDNFEIKTDKDIFLGVENSTVNINTDEIVVTNETVQMVESQEDKAIYIGSRNEGEMEIQIFGDQITLGEVGNVIGSADNFMVNVQTVFDVLQQFTVFQNGLKSDTSSFTLLPGGIDDGMAGYKILIDTLNLPQIQNVNQLGIIRIQNN